ncbi:MAG: lipoprotein [Luteimonas sp.]
MNTRLAIALIALTLPILSACGNKGPLVKPSEPVLTEVPDTVTPAPAANDGTTPLDTMPAPQTAPPVQIVPTPPQAPPVDDGDGSG